MAEPEELRAGPGRNVRLRLVRRLDLSADLQPCRGVSSDRLTIDSSAVLAPAGISC